MLQPSFAPRRRLPAVLLALLLLTAVAWPAIAQPPFPVPVRSVPGFAIAQPVPLPTPQYQQLDRIESTWVNLNPAQVRPLTITPDSAHIYAVNTYHNTVVHSDASLVPVDIFRTLWGPVSIALHVTPTDGPDSDRLLVVCQNSNALVVHNRLTGDVIDVITLPPRPADIVVKEDEHVAFVSTLGRNEVVEIDLITLQINQTFFIPSEDPLFLSLTPAGEVLVAANLSGNNSAVERYDPNLIPKGEFNPQANVRGILDLADTNIATAPGLPDEDVFWLDRTTGTAVAVARSVGTVNLAQGIHPTTGELWQLNIETNNKDATKQTEPLIKGQIAFNRLSKMTLANPLGSGVVQPTPANIIDLDLANLGGTYNPAKSVGKPYSIYFSPTGFVLLTGLLTDNVVILDSAGNWVTEWDLPSGCVPRQILLEATEQFAAVYCAGTHNVPVYYLGGALPPTNVLGPLTLGFDPTPPVIQQGRRLFYDGTFSEKNNASCATCHIEGGTENQAWNLSNGQIDNKGPMITQDLRGINRLVPFHWRGEQLRNLLDFNDAFVNLLGSTNKLSEVQGPNGEPSEFEQFEAFVLSLEYPANPNQNETRILDDSIQPPVLDPVNQLTNASAINGQVIFAGQCEECHGFPAGTSNEMVADGLVFSEVNPHRQWIKVAHTLNSFTKGIHPDVDVNLVGVPNQPQAYPLLGTGLAHSGNPRNIFHFVSFFFGAADARTSDVANFLYQFDTGLAPAVHSHVLLNNSTSAAAQARLNNYLIPEAATAKRNCDIGVFGRLTTGATSRIAGWVYNRRSGRFLRDDGVLQPLSFFVNRVAVSQDWFVFAGLPVGMGVGWAIDYDQDELYNALEPTTTNPPGLYVVDADGDTFWDGHEANNGGDPADMNITPTDTTPPSFVNLPVGGLAVQWSTAKVARLTFETSELTTYNLTLTPPGGSGLPQLNFTDTAPKLLHNVVIETLYPGQTYNASLTITDLAGLSPPVQAFSVQPEVFNDGSEVAVVDNLAWSLITDNGGGSVTFAATATTNKKTSGPPRTAAPNRVMVLRALVNGVPTTTNLTVPAGQPTAFCVNHFPYSALAPFGGVPGPFVITPATNGSGVTTINFTVTGLNSGDEVVLSVEAVSSLAAVPLCNGGVNNEPNLNPIDNVPPETTTEFIPGNWSFPDTPQAFRKISYSHP